MKSAFIYTMKVALGILFIIMIGGCGKDKTSEPLISDDHVIAFQGGVEQTLGGPRREIFTVNTDGTNLYQLTNTTSEEWIQTMDVSPTEAKIAYGLYVGGVWVINADGSDELKISDLGDVFDVQWSPDGSRVLFREFEDALLALAYADGSGERVFEALPSYWQHFSWSSDSERFALGATMDDPAVAVFDLTVESLDTLWVNDNGRITAIAWSPIDDRILFAYENFTDDNATIILINANSTVLDTLVDVPGINPRVYCIDWSPLGDEFLFYSEADDSDGLYIVDSNGSNMNLIASGDISSGACWSEDGSRIVFINMNVEYEICLIDADGSNTTKIAYNPLAIRDPGWVVEP